LISTRKLARAQHDQARDFNYDLNHTSLKHNGRVALYILDLFTGYKPLVPPERNADRSPCHLDIFQFAEHFATLVHIQSSIGLFKQARKFLIHPAGLVSRNRLSLVVCDITKVQYHCADGTVHPGGDAKCHLCPLLPVLAVGHGLDIDFNTYRGSILFKDLGVTNHICPTTTNGKVEYVFVSSIRSIATVLHLMFFMHVIRGGLEWLLQKYKISSHTFTITPVLEELSA